ncbi:flagellar basal body P-ring formation chaperone FlgA [Paracoccaceae bacterium GXU_MW_L88]
MCWLIPLLFLAAPLCAETLTVSRVIRPQEVLSAADILIAETPIAGAMTDPARAIGMEVKQAVYPGRPLYEGNLTPPAVIGRNDLCTLVYRSDGLEIRSEGRALDRAAEGDIIRVMNLESKMIVSGVATGIGIVEVKP